MTTLINNTAIIVIISIDSNIIADKLIVNKQFVGFINYSCMDRKLEKLIIVCSDLFVTFGLTTGDFFFLL